MRPYFTRRRSPFGSRQSNFDAVPADQRAAFSDVHGIPTSFGFTDSVVAAAEAAGLRVMPVVLRTPTWASRISRPACSCCGTSPSRIRV